MAEYIKRINKAFKRFNRRLKPYINKIIRAYEKASKENGR